MKQTFRDWVRTKPFGDFPSQLPGKLISGMIDLAHVGWEAGVASTLIESSVDILKVLDISTGHVTSEQMNHLIPNCSMFRHYENEYGSIVVIPPCLNNDAEGEPELEIALRKAVGNEVVNILKWAKDAKGCWAVNFDADAEKYPELFPVFDW